MSFDNVNVLKLVSVVLLLTVVVSGLAVVPMASVAQENPNNTTANNSTDNSTTQAGESAFNGSAELYIVQPHYVDNTVSKTSQGGNVIYNASGPVLELYPRNFNHSDVIEYGVEGEVGQLNYQSSAQRFVLNPQQSDGNYAVWFTVRETVDNRSVERTYRAIISVDKTDMRHYEAGEISDIRNNSENWTQWSSSVKSLGYDDVSKGTEIAYSSLVFISNPTAYLTGGYVSTWILIATQPGGILVLITILLAFLSISWFYIKYGNMRAAKDRAQKSLSEKKREAEYNDLLNQMSSTPPHAIYRNENDAEIVSEALGDSDNLLDLWWEMKERFSPAETIKSRLEVMHADGYVAVQKEDGLEVRLKDSVQSDVETKSLVELDSEEVSEVEYDGRVRRYNLPESEVDISEHLDVDIEEVNSRLDVKNAPTEDKKRWAEYMVDLASAVQTHRVTDTEGRVSGFVRLFESLLRLSNEAEKWDAPLARYYKEHFEYILQNYTVEAEGERIVEESKSAGDIR